MNGDFLDEYETGFRITGSDAGGKCLESADSNRSMKDLQNPILNFQENLSYSCSVSKSLTDLRTFCAAPTLSDFELFKNLDFFEHFGRLGNANYLFKKDWVQVGATDAFAQLGTAGSWSGNTQTCSLFAHVHYTIIFSEMGWTENPQK